ncbi:MAG: hypothetical protein JSV04_00020 [Candidatus Heimdallarchaeota archaeon]|nr:MAG: hypothetical protein JSV04_00020 [Candidatus Heimdallarchaeota archaeon]
MSSSESIPKSQMFQFRLTIEEWMAMEFERVTIQYENLLDVIDRVRFYGVNGLIQRTNRNVSPFYFQIISQQGEDFLLIAFSIPLFQSLDSIALQTAMEYFAAVLKNTLCERKPISDAEIKAFEEIKRLQPIRSKKTEIIPYEDFTEQIEVQLRMKIRMGLKIIPTTSIHETVTTERMKYLKELRKAKRALANIQANLKEYSQQIVRKYRINVGEYLFQSSIESRFEPVFIPVFTLNSFNQVKDIFSVIVLTEQIVNRINDHQLEILLAHEIIFNILKDKFSRGTLEKEIFLILSQEGKNDPEFLIEKEMSKFFNIEEVKEAQNTIREAVGELLQENYPIMQLD